jgi:hypothetical protein
MLFKRQIFWDYITYCYSYTVRETHLLPKILADFLGSKRSTWTRVNDIPKDVGLEETVEYSILKIVI